MKNEYSAHPALASEQLQRAERAATNSHSSHHKRYNSAGAAQSSGNGISFSRNCSPAKILKPSNKSTVKTAVLLNNNKEILGSTARSTITTSSTITATTPTTTTTATTASQKTLPVRTAAVTTDFVVGDVEIDFINDDDDIVDDNDEVKTTSTKDCVDCAPRPFSSNTNTSKNDNANGIYAPDHLQRRSSRNSHLAQDCNNSSRQHFQYRHNANSITNKNCSNTAAATVNTSACIASNSNSCGVTDGCISGLSSAISSPSPSTVSSPLSTPTRCAAHYSHHEHHSCCQKATTTTSGLCGGTSCATGSPHHHQLHDASHHHHHHHASNASGCKELQKFDLQLEPSPYRQLLPIALCILSFATVFSILIIYMDTTEIRHQQFRLNMSRDNDLYGVAQDNPILIAFLREIHMHKYPMHFLKDRESPVQHLNFSSAAYHDELAPKMAHYVADLVGGKMNGAMIQSLTGTLGQLITAPWLAETLKWTGVIVEPEPRRYFTLRKQNSHRPGMQVVHACVSPNPYPKEVTIHNEESEVRINSLLDETSVFNSRVKCFPLYTIMLACNRVEYDLLSLGVHGHELEILQTLPFDIVRIEVISIHLLEEHAYIREYIKSITQFLMGKSYKLQKKFGYNYFYQRIKTTNRTRKKDILLYKTP